MPIIASEPTAERGRKDARRHREKQRDAIKERLPEIIADESIITHKKGKVVKVPIRSIDIPHFKPKTGDEQSGIGQGSGKPGDVIGQKRLPNGEPGEAGQEPGEDYIETEIPIEELIEMMLEDLGLPKLEEKEMQNITIELGWKIAGLGKAGIWPLLDKRATAREGIRRFWYFIRALESETGQDELTCFRALKQSNGVLADALEVVKTNSVTDQSESVEPFPIFTNEDLRYRQIKEDTQEQSRAVVVAMMDVSGSMGDMKKYLARSMIFWLVEFLRRLYVQVEVRFIIHHTVAKIVPEEDFFRTVESGGTFCYTAYEKASGLVDSEYPTDGWNVYVWHFSDGDDFDRDKTVGELNKLIAKGVNMVGYGEIDPDERGSSTHGLWSAFKDGLGLEEKTVNDMDILTGPDTLPFLGVKIEEREDILPALKTFLKKDRWAQ
ncbi:MAG TPA: DUF444 family protein [Candidatus Paceibacterota bacterium]|nr:DUF444 family protein [Candidatus Paceibacterota bacterium]